MPVLLAKVMQKERTIEWGIGEGDERQTGKLTYRPDCVTPALLTSIQDIEQNGDRKDLGVARLLSIVMVKWDALDVNGEPIPVTEKDLTDKVHIGILWEVWNQIQTDQQEAAEARKNSATGSFTKAK